MTVSEIWQRMERAWNLEAPTSIKRGELEKAPFFVATGGVHPQSDEEQARNVARELTNKALYVPERGWYWWDGHAWKEDTENKVAFATREVIRTKDDCASWSFVANTQSWSKRPLTMKTLGYVIRGCESDPRLVASMTRFDADPYTLNTPGGLYDLTTGEVIETEKSPPLVMKSTAVAPVAGPAPLWESVLESAFPGDPQTQAYVEKTLALALFGNQDVQQFWMYSGEAGSGKGTIQNTIMEILGTGEDGYAMPVEMEFLMSGGKEGHPEKYARLYGKRLVVASEAEQTGAAFSAARVKNLTGGDIISGRFMRGNTFSFRPTWKLFLMTNYRPNVSYEDEGFWRRFREIPFRHKPDGPVIANLKDRLVNEEGPAILARLIERAREFMTEGLQTPETVRMATLENRGEQDHVEQFIQDECTPGGRSERNTFYDTYTEWCKRNRIEPIAIREVTKRLKVQECKVTRSNGKDYYSGVTLNAPVLLK